MKPKFSVGEKVKLLVDEMVEKEHLMDPDGPISFFDCLQHVLKEQHKDMVLTVRKVDERDGKPIYFFEELPDGFPYDYNLRKIFFWEEALAPLTLPSTHFRAPE